MIWRLNFALLLAVMFLAGCKTGPVNSRKPEQFSHFTGLTDFTGFTHTTNGDGRVTLLSPKITSPFPWDQLVVSWNVSASPGTFLEVEAAANLPGHATKFYSLGQWTPSMTRLNPTATANSAASASAAPRQARGATSKARPKATMVALAA